MLFSDSHRKKKEDTKISVSHYDTGDTWLEKDDAY